jgi:hypothetical protein
VALWLVLWLVPSWGVSVGEAAEPDNAGGGTCRNPALARYASQPYATASGIRRRCRLLEDIERHAQPLPAELRERVSRELANRYAVEVDFAGAVDIPRRAVDYLLQHMPEAADLTRMYSRKEYTATQSDPPYGPGRFFVTDNSSFAADFTYLLSSRSAAVSEYMFFETGRAKVLFWMVWGNSFIHYELRQDGDEASRYDIRIHVFTESRLLRVLLGSGLFHHFASLMFKDVVRDVESAVHRFDADPRSGEILPPYFVQGLKTALHAEPPHRVPWSGTSGR